VAGVFAFFGVIHSPLPAAPIDLPWHVFAQLQTEHAGDARFLSQSPYHWALAYGLSAVLLGILSLFPGKEAAAHETASEAGLSHGGAVL
jgi:hypothetical protein